MSQILRDGLIHTEQVGHLTVTVDVAAQPLSPELLFRISGKGFHASCRPVRDLTITVRRDEDGKVLHHDRYLVEDRTVTPNLMQVVAVQAALAFVRHEPTSTKSKRNRKAVTA